MTDNDKLLEELQDARNDLADLLEKLQAAEETIEDLESKLDETEDERDDLEERVLEDMSPSSRRPPPHFKLPDDRPSVTHKFRIGLGDLGRGYLIASTYPDSCDVGEIFIHMRKRSDSDLPGHLKEDQYVVDLHRQVSELTSFLRGVLDQLAIAVSIGLQRGIPLETYARKYRGANFPPYGMTCNPDFLHAKSIVDYIFRWLGSKFIESDEWKPPKRR